MTRNTDTLTVNRPSSQMTPEELQHVRWAGWAILIGILVAWAGWVSLLAISTDTALNRTEERQELHYEQLHTDIQDIKSDVRAILRQQTAARDLP